MICSEFTYSAGAKKNLRDQKPPPVVPHHSRRAGAEVKRVMSAPVYDDPNTIISANGVSRNSVPINQYEAPTEPRKSRSRTPKFDDTIYAIRRDVGLEEEEGGEEMDDGAAGNMSESPHTSHTSHHTHTSHTSHMQLCGIYNV